MALQSEVQASADKVSPWRLTPGSQHDFAVIGNVVAPTNMSIMGISSCRREGGAKKLAACLVRGLLSLDFSELALETQAWIPAQTKLLTHLLLPFHLLPLPSLLKGRGRRCFRVETTVCQHPSAVHTTHSPVEAGLRGGMGSFTNDNGLSFMVSGSRTDRNGFTTSSTSFITQKLNKRKSWLRVIQDPLMDSRTYFS